MLGLLVKPEARPLALRSFAALALGGVLTLLIHFPALPEMFDFYLQPAAGATTAEVEWKSPLWLVNEAIRSFGVPLELGWGLAALASVPFAAGGFGLLRRAPATAFLFALPALLGFVAMVALERNLWPRFFFNSFGFIALVGLRGVEEIGTAVAARIRAPAWLPVAALGVIVAASAATVPRNYVLPKQDYTGAREWVLTQAAEGDAIVALDLAADAYRRHYAPEFGSADTLEELRSAASEEGHTWVLYSFGGYIEAREPSLWNALLHDFEEVEAFHGTLGGGAIVVRRTRTAGTFAGRR